MVLTYTIKSPKKINKPHIRHWPDHDSAIHASLQQKSEQKTVHLESLRISYSATLPICNVLKDIFAYFYINILLIYEFEYINSLTAMNRPVFPFLYFLEIVRRTRGYGKNKTAKKDTQGS